MAEAGRELERQAAPRFWRRYGELTRNVVAIGFVSLLNDASSEIIYPLLPLFLASALAASPAAIGLIEGAAESVSSLLKLFSGYFSDRRGKRKGLVVFGYALAGLVRPLLAFASSWPQVLVIRLTDRIGKGIRSAPRDAMIADSSAPHLRGLAFGFHRAMDHAGAVIGPLIGFAILWLVASDPMHPTAADYARVFLMASVPALAAVCVAAFVVRETAGANAGATAVRPQLSLRGFDVNFRRLLFILALFTLSNSSDAFLLLRAQEAGVAVAALPVLWAALHVSKVTSSLVGGNLSDRVGRKPMIVIGWALYGAVYVGFALVERAWAAWALFLIYGLYFGLTEGVEKALVADLVRAEQRGTAYGLYNFAIGVMVFPASLLMGAMWSLFGARTAFLVSAGVGLFAAALLAILVRSPSGESRARA